MPSTRAQVLVEVHGYVENPNTPNDRRPYMQKFSTPVLFGRGQLSQALDAAIAVFKVSKKSLTLRATSPPAISLS